MDMPASRCGLCCTGCAYRTDRNCGGCIETNGRPFHGEFPVAKCCQERGFVHCGECPEIPCGLLTQYSCDPEHGDTPQGARIERCKRWAIGAPVFVENECYDGWNIGDPQKGGSTRRERPPGADRSLCSRIRTEIL